MSSPRRVLIPDFWYYVQTSGASHGVIASDDCLLKRCIRLIYNTLRHQSRSPETAPGPTSNIAIFRQN